MTNAPDLQALFPTRDAIPADAWRTPDDAGLTLLIGGERRTWDGTRDEIRSAVCVCEKRTAASIGWRSVPGRSAAPSWRSRPSLPQGAPGLAVAASGRARRVASALPACSISCAGRGRCASRSRAR